MPVIKSAKKKLRKDKKLTERNKAVKNLFKKAVKEAEKFPTEKNVLLATKMADKSAKKRIIHKNKASRIKSKLAKLLVKKSDSKKVDNTKPKKKVSTKASQKKK